MKKTCPFCEINSKDVDSRIIDQNEYAFVIRDGFPISSGHTLVIPKRHVGSFFEISQQEQTALYDLLKKIKLDCDKELHPDAYNIGINDGVAAGQTVPHLHIHLIPRYQGDKEDPRGGIRWLFPDKANYWS